MQLDIGIQITSSVLYIVLTNDWYMKMLQRHLEFFYIKN